MVPTEVNEHVARSCHKLIQGLCFFLLRGMLSLTGNAGEQPVARASTGMIQLCVLELIFPYLFSYKVPSLRLTVGREKKRVKIHEIFTLFFMTLVFPHFLYSA